MFAARMRRCLLVCAAICSIAAVTLPARGADLQREKEARALLAEGERLNEATRLYEALSTLQRVHQQYPDTEAGAFSEFWRAEVLARLGNTTEAIETDQRIVRENPGAILACWAQYGMSQMMGPAAGGIAAMRKVRDMLPNRSDLTPFDLSRVVLGDWCGKYLVGHQDVLDAAEFLGLNRNDTRDKAEALAIVAAHVARTDGIEKAKPILDRLISECSGERGEVEWAKIEAAIACIDGKPGKVEYETLSVGWLTPYSVMTLSEDDQAAKACLALARYYKRNDKLSDAVAALKHAADRHANTGHGAQVLYEYGCALGRQGRNEEAIAALKQVIARKPLSTYATAAGIMIDNLQRIQGSESASLEALIKEADANFDPKWKDLAFVPADSLAGDPVMVARQVVAMAREDLAEQALSVLDRFAAGCRVSVADLVASKCEVALGSLQTSARASIISRRSIYALYLVISTPATDDMLRAYGLAVSRAEPLLRAWSAQLDSPEERAVRLHWLGAMHQHLGSHSAAVVAYRDELQVPGTGRQTRCDATYQLALCYRALGRNEAALRHMRAVADQFSDTEQGREAARLVAAWSVPRQR